jgi:hypothetical protein
VVELGIGFSSSEKLDFIRLGHELETSTGKKASAYAERCLG